MKVKCIINKGNNLPDNYIEKDSSKETIFNVEINYIYNVYGMCMYDNALYYLLYEEGDNYPDWYPAILFQVVDKTLNHNWYHNSYGVGNSNGVVAIWGYQELVASEKHYRELIEREADAGDIFYKRRLEFDKFNNTD